MISEACPPTESQKEGEPLMMILEHAERRGLSSGVITNSPLADATPAACYAHAARRNLTSEIFSQLLSPRLGDGPDVLIGVGRMNILAATGKLGVDIEPALRARGFAVPSTKQPPPQRTRGRKELGRGRATQAWASPRRLPGLIVQLNLMGATVSQAPACDNCGEPLAGRYCSSCGQRSKPLDPTLHDLLHEAVHEFAHLDGKIAATVKALLFHPGRLTAEFLAGRRARYVSPVRLYLTFSVLFFLMAAAIPRPTPKPVVQFRVPVTSQKGSAVPGRFARAGKRAAENPEALKHAFYSNASRVMFLLVPVFAAGLRLVYRKTGRRYPAFIYFSLHYHAFAFAAFSLVLPFGFTGNLAIYNGVEATVLIWCTVYLVIALRRAFGGSTGRTVWRTLALGALYFPCFIVAVMAAALFSLFTA